MNKKIVSLIKNENGVALIHVLIVFTVLAILSASVAFISSTNLKQSVAQEEKMRAHYLLLGGIDVARSTLLMPLYVDNNEEKNMIDWIIANANDYSLLEDSIDIEGETVVVKVNYNFDNDEITITSSLQGTPHSLTLVLNVSGPTYSERWE